MFDVLVVGGGMAGSIAALVARERGARVAVAHRSWGATALSTGALDIAFAPALSAAYQAPRTVAEHVMDIAAHRRRHPFAVLGIEKTLPGIGRGFEALRRALDGSGLEPPELDLEAENLHVPSSLGVAMPAASALAPHLGIDLATPLAGRWGVLGLHGQASFDARRLIEGLKQDAAQVSGALPDLVEILLPFAGHSPSLVLARTLDDQATCDALARDLEGQANGLAGIIAPPVLGLERHVAVRHRMAEAAGVPVVESLAHMPSVPGVRLQQALDAAMRRAGIENVGDVAGVHVDGRRVQSVVTRDELEISAGTFVLATGRYVSGGVTWTGRCQETLFGLPVSTEEGPLEEDSPHPVVRDTPMESHPLMTAGVQVDQELRPIREGRVAYENLFAAGMVIGGFASRYALCADGVALASGYWAGTAALGGES